VGELGGIEAPSSSGNVSSSTTQLKIFNHSSFIGTNVSNKPGGGIIVDQSCYKLRGKRKGGDYALKPGHLKKIDKPWMKGSKNVEISEEGLY